MSCDIEALLILQPFHCFIYVTAHSIHYPTLLSLHLCHSSFSNPYIASPTSQLILQPFCCFTYIIGTSPTSPGEPPMPLWWCLLYPWWFCNLQWMRPAGLYERCKLALELKRLKTPGVDPFFYFWQHWICFTVKICLVQYNGKQELVLQVTATVWIIKLLYSFC